MARRFSPRGLNAKRDDYVRRAKALIVTFGEFSPSDVKGILGRAGSVLRSQREALQELSALDLEVTPADTQPFDMALTRAQHLPRMIQAFARLEVQQEQEETLRPMAEAAADLGLKLALLTQGWVLAHMEPKALQELLAAEGLSEADLLDPDPLSGGPGAGSDLGAGSDADSGLDSAAGPDADSGADSDSGAP